MTERRDRDKPVSLHGLDPEEALRALLAVKPDDDPTRGTGSQEGKNSEPPPEGRGLTATE